MSISGYLLHARPLLAWQIVPPSLHVVQIGYSTPTSCGISINTLMYKSLIPLVVVQ